MKNIQKAENLLTSYNKDRIDNLVSEIKSLQEAKETIKTIIEDILQRLKETERKIGF